MLSLRIALLLPLLAATLWAAPLTKYDQRQDGDLNAHIHLENFVILLIPGGLRGFNIAAKVAPGRKHLARPALAHAHAHAHAQGAAAEAETPGDAPGDAPGNAPAHGLKAPPYHVDIDASRRPPPLVLEITPGAAGDEQHEVVIAESPAVLLPKRPSSPAEPQPPAEAESNGVSQGTVPPPPSTPAAPAEAPKPPKADPAPTRVADKPKKPAASAPAPAAPAADKPKRPTPAPAAAPASSDKPKRPAAAPAADKPKRPVAAPAAVSPVVAAPAPVSAPAPSPAPALPEAAPEASETEAPAKPAPAPAQAGGDRAARVAALGVGLEAAPAGGAPCAHGGCVHAQDPVGVYEDSLLKALSFGLEPAH